MGYELNSPTKKIWIPIEYNWLSEKSGNTPFLEFNEEYKKKYGIDLMEIVKLYNGFILIKGDVSTYIVTDSTYKVSLVNNCPFVISNQYISGDTDGVSSLKCIDQGTSTGFGIEFTIPKSSTFDYESIIVNLYEA